MKLERIRKFLVRGLSLLVLLLVWFSPSAQQQSIDTEGWYKLIPSGQIDDRVVCQKSNNNLDVIEYHGRYFIGFRTAPNHFASKKTKLYIISSGDLVNWEYEHEIHLGYDMREPRFAVYKDTLRMYFFEAGKRPLKFEPKHIWMTRFDGHGNWSELLNMNLDGYVNWRFRERSDTLYLSAYYGRDLYNQSHLGNQRLFYSTNGTTWDSLSQFAQVTEQGAEEGEFIFDSHGNLWGTVRVEGGGGMIVHAAKDDLQTWITKRVQHKYDSALLFEHNGEYYLIARRNMDGTSEKSKMRMYNLLRYSLTKKKTALYHLNRASLEIDWILDFPSTGDTAFPGITPLGDGKYFLINYSSDIHGKEKNWLKGQLGKTYIYQTILDMDEILNLNTQIQ